MLLVFTRKDGDVPCFFVSLPEGTLQTRFVPKDCGAITENNYVWEPQKPKPKPRGSFESLRSYRIAIAGVFAGLRDIVGGSATIEHHGSWMFLHEARQDHGYYGIHTIYSYRYIYIYSTCILQVVI